MIERRSDEWHKEEISRPQNKVQPGIEHQVDLTHIIRRPRHRIAYRLYIMEAHAFSQKARIKFITDISFETLPD